VCDAVLRDAGVQGALNPVVHVRWFAIIALGVLLACLVLRAGIPIVAGTLDQLVYTPLLIIAEVPGTREVIVAGVRDPGTRGLLAHVTGRTEVPVIARSAVRCVHAALGGVACVIRAQIGVTAIRGRVHGLTAGDGITGVQGTSVFIITVNRDADARAGRADVLVRAGVDVVTREPIVDVGAPRRHITSVIRAGIFIIAHQRPTGLADRLERADLIDGAGVSVLTGASLLIDVLAALDHITGVQCARILVITGGDRAGYAALELTEIRSRAGIAVCTGCADGQGVGAHTRLTEVLCAGLPILTSIPLTRDTNSTDTGVSRRTLAAVAAGEIIGRLVHAVSRLGLTGVFRAGVGVITGGDRSEAHSGLTRVIMGTGIAVVTPREIGLVLAP